VDWTETGTMRSGVCSAQVTSGHLTPATGCSCWLTPGAGEAVKVSMTQNQESIYHQLRGRTGWVKNLQVNPDWMESLMGWPVGWTALGRRIAGPPAGATPRKRGSRRG